MKDSKGAPKENLTPEDRENLRSVYILTIPAFTWVKAPNPDPTWRSLHTCENLNGRQMLVIGGTQEDLPQAMDPRPNGLGIYDLVNLNWTGTYDPDGQLYIQPSIVKELYIKTAGQPTAWGDPALPGIFKVKQINSPATTIPASTAPAVPTSTPVTLPSSETPHMNVKTIILASTLSATLFVVLLLVLTICLCKRSIAFRNAETDMAALVNSKSSTSTSFSRTEGGSLPAEVHADRIWTEMLDSANYHEMDENRTTPVWEIDGADNGKAWIRKPSTVGSASIYSVNSRKNSNAFHVGQRPPDIDSPTLSSPVFPIQHPLSPSPIKGSPSMKSVRSARAPSVRSNVEDSLEWRRTMHKRGEEMPVDIAVPSKPVLSLVTNGEWI